VWGQGGEMTQALYAHMNNKTIKKYIAYIWHLLRPNESEPWGEAQKTYF
jgi:hypothetical protein